MKSARNQPYIRFRLWTGGQSDSYCLRIHIMFCMLSVFISFSFCASVSFVVSSFSFFSIYIVSVSCSVSLLMIDCVCFLSLCLCLVPYLSIPLSPDFFLALSVAQLLFSISVLAYSFVSFGVVLFRIMIGFLCITIVLLQAFLAVHVVRRSFQSFSLMFLCLFSPSLPMRPR